ncbi:hypothetical protein Vadar_031345 [Vaccinium darrowii]|uniref:Uncharacterized protein n=1 Tax=Vaccinium darrowii TaxID=229202 RepID=A0ACB7XDH6_9ERIC|nr:hypothetical protein Vadar_031345 [Vaccinium darrowii]
MGVGSGTPYGFDVGQSEKGNVVKGLDLGVEGMRVGGQMNIDLSVADGHLCNMGMMIEELESQLRNSFDQAYFGKTKEVVCALLQPTELLKVRLPGS